MKLNTAAEAMAKYGLPSMNDESLLMAIGIPSSAAKELLHKTDYTLGAIARLPLTEIQAIKGIGKNKAAAIIAAIELGRRRQTEMAKHKESITSSLDIYNLVHPQLRDLTQEVFVIVLLDRRSRVIKIEQIHVGGMSAMVVDPKVIFQTALQYKASSLILIHNHPSGASSPSMEDMRLTEKVKLAGGYIDIKVLDHVIIGDGAYYSFADEGKI